MNKRLLGTMILVLGLTLLMVGMVAGANYPDLTGSWSGKIYCVGWNPVEYYDVTGNFELEILSQNPSTGNFYGTIVGLYPLTGNVSTDKTFTAITYWIDADIRIFTGKVMGKKLSGTWNHYKADQIDTCKFELTKE